MTRAAEEGTPVLTEQIGPGAATLLQPGDSVYEDGVVHVTENEGDEPAVIWIAALLAADQPGTQLHEVATPAPAAS